MGNKTGKIKVAGRTSRQAKPVGGKLFVIGIKAVLNRILLVSAFFPVLFLYGSGLRAQPSERSGVRGPASFVFYFRPGSNILERNYRDNASGVDKMDSLMQDCRPGILSGDNHFSIISYIKPSEIHFPAAVNRASVLASVVRAVAVVHSNFSHSHFSFVFDTAACLTGQVRLTFVPGPLPGEINQDIHYTLSKKKDLISYAASLYHPFPLAGAAYPAVPADNARDASGRFTETPALSSKSQSQTVLPAQATPAGQVNRETTGQPAFVPGQPEKPGPAPAAKKQQEPHQQVAAPNQETQAGSPLSAAKTTARPADRRQETPAPQEQQAVSERPAPTSATKLQPAPAPRRKRRLFPALKTNLLSLSGVTAESGWNGPIPNIQAEWYGGKHWSVNADFSYAYFEKNNSERETRGVSAAAVEPRFWISGDGAFEGLYTGLYALTGDFDVKQNSIPSTGYTGAFYEAGLSFGYYYPLSCHWGLEGGFRFGYRGLECDTYAFQDPHFYKESSFERNAFKLTGISLSITYRLDKRAKE